MFFLNTTMLREKFTVVEDLDADNLVAVGNRISLPLISMDGRTEERLVVRGQNMALTLHMAAMIAKHFYRDGPLLKRTPSFSWRPNWDLAQSDFEKRYNPLAWVAVYHKGRVIFSTGAYHTFLDVIEQCDARNRLEYDNATRLAEEAFLIAGKKVSIQQSSNIALVIGAMKERTRVGLIYRHPRRSSTFNFTVDALKDPQLALQHAANWLEAVQLSVAIGFRRGGRKPKESEPYTIHDADTRLRRLRALIEQFDMEFKVMYRPDQPKLATLMEEAQEVARAQK